MNNTKWKEIRDYFYNLEISDEYNHILISYNTKTLDGYIAGEDVCWEHLENDLFKDIEWLYIVLTEENKGFVLKGLKKIRVPAEIIGDKLYIYGYKNDIEYL